jgi:outer membrane biosynthesis protein TonB
MFRLWETQQIMKKPGDMLAQAADALTSGRVRQSEENQREAEETEKKEKKEQEQEQEPEPEQEQAKSEHEEKEEPKNEKGHEARGKEHHGKQTTNRTRSESWQGRRHTLLRTVRRNYLESNTNGSKREVGLMTSARLGTLMTNAGRAAEGKKSTLPAHAATPNMTQLGMCYYSAVPWTHQETRCGNS